MLVVAPDRAFGDNAASPTKPATDRRLLNDEPRRPDPDFECRVIEVARRSPRSARRQRLEDATVESHELPTSSERQPVQVDGRPLRSCCGPGGESARARFLLHFAALI